MKRFIYCIIALCAGLCAGAQAPVDSTALAVPTIADRIVSAGKARISQPEALNRRLVKVVKDEPAAAGQSAKASVGGFRVLLFSGNNARTAKAEAENRAAAVGERFPEHRTYVTYDAPYWRLKVGDFRAYEDAAAALSELKAAFPSFAREMRMVRERIHVEE